MQSLNIEAESSAPVVVAASSDKLDETLVAQAIQCLDMEKLRSGVPLMRSYQASVPAALDPKTSDALDRLGVVLASTQLRIVGQTCTPKEIHIVRLSPNSMQLDISVQDIVKANSRFVVANLGPDAQIGCVWFYGDPPNTFSGQLEKVDPGKFRAVRCTAPSQLSLRVNAAFASPSIDDDDARRRSVANKYTLVMFVFGHDKNPKPTPVASVSVPTKRKITSVKEKSSTQRKEDNDDDAEDDVIDSHNGDDDDEEEEKKKLNGHATRDDEELWTSAESVKSAVSRQRDKLRAATGQDLAALKALATERGKSVEDIITAVSWWVLGRASSLSRSLGSFFLSKPYDWFEVVYARLPLESRRLTPAFTAANEAILQPYVFNILTVMINNVGLVPQWTVHHAKLSDKYRAQLKKFKVLEIMGSEPFIDGLANESTVFAFQKAFSFLFCIRMLRYLTPDQLLRMSPNGVIDAVKPKLDEYLRCKDGNKRKPAAADSSTKQVKRKVEDEEPSKAEVKKEDEEDKKPKKKPRRKAASDDDDDESDSDKAKKKKKKSKSTPKKKKTSDDEEDDDNDDESAKKKKKKKPKQEKDASGGKDKALLAASKTASKAPVDVKSSNNDDKEEDGDDQGTMVMTVMPSPLLQTSVQQHVAKEEYAHLLQTARKLIKTGDEKQISEYDWVAAAETMQRVRPRFNKLSPAPSNLSTARNIEVGPKVLKVRPVQHLKVPLSHVANKGVQQFMSNVLNAEGHWDVLKVAGQKLPSFEAKDSYLFQFAEASSSSSSSSVKDQVYAVELQYHPQVHRLCTVGLFKAKDEAAPKAHRLLDSSLFAEVWYVGPSAALDMLKLDIDRIPGAATAIEDA